MNGFRLERWILFYGVLALSGCANVLTASYDTLSASTQAVSASSTDTYTRFLKLEQKKDVLSASSAAIGSKPGDSASDIGLTTFDPLTEKNTTYRKELEKREAALGILVNYTKVVDAFANKDYRADVDKASTQLTASINSFGTSLDKSFPNYPNEKQALALLGTFVSELGGIIANHERETALKQIMTDAQPWIVKLTDLLIHDNTQLEAATDDLLNIDASIKKDDGHGGSVTMQDRGILASYNLLLKSAQGMDRLALVQQASDTIAEAKEIKLALAALSNALAKIPAAHQQMLASLDKPSSSLTALTDLVAEAQRANQFYQTLNK